MTLFKDEIYSPLKSQVVYGRQPDVSSAVPPGPVLIVAENASAANGGEASIPLMYFRLLRERGADVRLLVHDRCRAELESLFPDDDDRIHCVPDTAAQRWLWRVSSRLPARLACLAIGFLIQFITQLAQRRAARRLVKEHGIVVVHQPTPVSPRMPSMMSDLGAPVVIGPMNGSMSFPPAFRSREHAVTRWSIALLRRLSTPLHALITGKRNAAMLLVANDRTRDALPGKLRQRTTRLCENAVDLSLWRPRPRTASHDDSVVRFVFSGRLAELKGVDLLLVALARARSRQGTSDDIILELDILGDGDVTDALRQQAGSLGLNGAVRFLGWQPRVRCAEVLAASDALVMPSLCECGGAVVLEAMALRLPVIAAKWGGPGEYVDESCGVLVAPTSREAFIAGLEDALVKLATSPALRDQLGRAGRRKIEEEYDWNVRIDDIVGMYHRATRAPARSHALRRTRERHNAHVSDSVSSGRSAA